MSENHDEPRLFAELQPDDAVAEALRDVGGLLDAHPPAASAALAAFMASPSSHAASPNHELKRKQSMKVIHLKASRIRRAAAAAGAAVALATVGAAAMAATGGPAATSVVQDADPTGTETTTTTDPSETTTTAEPTETETTSTTASPTETEEATETAEPTETVEPTETADPTETEDADQSEPKAEKTPNPRAYENHHDGKGADDEHADVRGGGSVDHRAGKGSQQSGDDEGDKITDSRSGGKATSKGKKHG